MNIDAQPRYSHEQATSAIGQLETNVEKVIRGKDAQVRLAVACLLAEGHLLIEDKPGTGKTTLAKAIAASIGGQVRRVQFTPDLLPSDITGISIFNPVLGEFSFRDGPAFTNILIADEINRASPKTQAALLEVMEERHITNDGVSRPVPSPFMVVATQNPLDFQGTYPLPEVQLDRFAMKLSLGYADREAELEVMRRDNSVSIGETISPIFTTSQFRTLIQSVRNVAINDTLRSYVADIVDETRRHLDLRLGVSTRGTLILLAVARGFALANGRDYVIADDIKELGGPVLAHRIAVTPEAEIDGIVEADIIQQIFDKVSVPRSPAAHIANA